MILVVYRNIGSDIMATIQEIADQVGISKAAVSRILNNKGSFSSETIEKVFQTAKLLNYSTPLEVKAFENLDFKIIAAVFPIVNIPYYSILVSYLEQAAYSFGYSLMICSSIFEKDKEEVLFRYLKERKINGMIYGSFTNGVSIQEDMPIVTIGHQISETIPVVRSDNYMAGVLAARHLMSKRCKKYLYISGYKVGIKRDDRYKGFKEELNRKGLSVSSYFTGLDERKKDVLSVISQMLIDHADADGIFAESATLATQCLRVATDLGIRVPKDLKIIGYGNDGLNAYTFPKLSLVRENTELIAQLAISKLVDIIEENDSNSLENSIVPVSIEQNATT